MKYLKNFFKTFICCLSLCVLSAANAEDYVEGKQYQRAGNEIKTNPLVQDLFQDGKGKVQVLEFFSYGCGWCFKVDPFIEKWRKTLPASVDFQRVPVEFHPSWGTLTKAYYTQVNLKNVDKIHSALFDAVQNGRMDDPSEENLRQFFIPFGISEQDFKQAFESFDVTRQQKWANAISRAYRVTAVPVIIVQGPSGIYTTAVKMTGSEDELIKVLDYLVKKESAALNTQNQKVTLNNKQ